MLEIADYPDGRRNDNLGGKLAVEIENEENEENTTNTIQSNIYLG